MRPEELRAVLARLTGANTPWFAVTSWPGAAAPGLAAAVIDVCELRDVPITVDPFEPPPGCPVQAHVERLAGLLEAAFHPAGPVRAAIRLALRRVYTDHGWDLVGGTAVPGAVAPPGVPTFAELRHAAAAAAAELGCDTAGRAAVRAFLDVTLAPLWAGQAGRFLTGGHPADVAALSGANTIFRTDAIVGEETLSFLAGVFLLRLAGQLCTRRSQREPFAVVITMAAGRLRRALDEIRAAGAEVILARPDQHQDRYVAAGDPAQARLPLLGRRSLACGLACRQRPCTGRELHDADLQAAAAGQVWLRLWAQALVLAFVTGRPLPQVPQPLLHAPHQLADARARQCLLGTVVQAAVGSRAMALRHSYPPERLTAVVASVAAGQLATAGQHGAARPRGAVSPQGAAAPRGAVSQYGAAAPPGAAGEYGAGGQHGTEREYRLGGPHGTAGQPGSGLTMSRAGHFWVIPQLRWLHEAERLHPLGKRQPAPDDIAPPLDFGLAGLIDWPGISVADRLAGLYRHRLSMDHEQNRTLATIALLGTEPDSGLVADLVLAGTGGDEQERLRYAARMLGTAGHGAGPGWLEVLLSWPGRLIASSAERDLCQAATG